MTLQELKSEAKRQKQEQNFEEALNSYKQIWEQEKNEWNGYFLAQCYRKVENFEEARKLHDHFDRHFPNFTPIKNEKLWLTYNEKIKDWKNDDLVSDAEQLIAQANQYDKYTSSVYTKTVLRVVRHHLYHNNEHEALIWLDKVDQSVISNSIYTFQGIIYPADRKVYFIRLADVLIRLDKHISYIESCLTSLNFDGTQHTQFKKYIIDAITFINYISRVRLALFIKYFQEEVHLRKKNSYKKIYNAKKTTLISDLSHYLFCPVSFAINETFEIKANTTWEKDEWLKEKRLLIDRHSIYQKKSSYDECFDDSEIIVDSNLINDFGSIFESTIITNNVTNPIPTIYSNLDNSLRGAPDYIFVHPLGHKFALTEKFSGINSADGDAPFESDLIKHYAFLEELITLDLSYGLFLTWYWKLRDIDTNSGQIKKKIIVSAYRLTKINANPSNVKKLSRAIVSVNNFKKDKSMEIDGSKISYANKCLNCSVISYCNHKTGKFDKIELPYSLSTLPLKKEPSILSESQDNVGTNEDLDNLPF